MTAIVTLLIALAILTPVLVSGLRGKGYKITIGAPTGDKQKVAYKVVLIIIAVLLLGFAIVNNYNLHGDNGGQLHRVTFVIMTLLVVSLAFYLGRKKS